MSSRHKNGFTISEFLITVISLFSGLYFIFWTCYLGCNFALAKFYLDDFSFCELNSRSKDCWVNLKRRVDSLKFVKINRLYTEHISTDKVVHLNFDYALPIIGLTRGVEDIKLSSSVQPSRWQ